MNRKILALLRGFAAVALGVAVTVIAVPSQKVEAGVLHDHLGRFVHQVVEARGEEGGEEGGSGEVFTVPEDWQKSEIAEDYFFYMPDTWELASTSDIYYYYFGENDEGLMIMVMKGREFGFSGAGEDAINSMVESSRDVGEIIDDYTIEKIGNNYYAKLHDNAGGAEIDMYVVALPDEGDYMFALVDFAVNKAMLPSDVSNMNFEEIDESVMLGICGSLEKY